MTAPLPFPSERLDDVITQDEMKAIFESYQKVAGYHVDLVNKHAERKDAR